MRAYMIAGATAAGLLATPAQAQVVNTPSGWAPASGSSVVQTTPGVQVRLAGRYRAFAAHVQSDFNNATGTVAGAAGNQTSGTIDLYDYGRLWPGFDVMTPSGIRYGAQLEIRLQGSSSTNDRGVLRYRQMYGYVASPSGGQLRFGSSMGAIGLMNQGFVMGSIGTGLWDGDGPIAISGNARADTFWFSSSSFNNRTKITYLSPQFMGLDVGISYAPNTGTFDSSCGTPTATASSNCDRLDASNVDADTQRDRNRYELIARYRGSIGPVGLGASIGYLGSDTVGAEGNAFGTEGLSMYLGGLTLQAYGVTLGGIITGGRGNYATQTRTTQALGLTAANTTSSSANLTPLPRDIGADDMFTWQVGAMYTLGAWQFGIAYHEATYEGNVGVAADAKDRGLGIGGRYAVAPGFNIIAEYLYGTREETGVNQVTGAAGSANNKGTTNLIQLGMAFNW